MNSNWTLGDSYCVQKGREVKFSRWNVLESHKRSNRCAAVAVAHTACRCVRNSDLKTDKQLRRLLITNVISPVLRPTQHSRSCD